MNIQELKKETGLTQKEYVEMIISQEEGTI